MSAKSVSLLLLIGVVSVVYCYTAKIARPDELNMSDEIVLSPKKRPFCNAFTGCGRKRSDSMMPARFMQRQDFTEESAPYIYSDDIVELSRRIIAGARLWDALQEANELSRRKEPSHYETV